MNAFKEFVGCVMTKSVTHLLKLIAENYRQNICARVLFNVKNILSSPAGWRVNWYDKIQSISPSGNIKYIAGLLEAVTKNTNPLKNGSRCFKRQQKGENRSCW
jgi:hypothetical protein